MKKIPALFILFFPTLLFGQPQDSLVVRLDTQIQKATTDSIRIQYQIELADHVRSYNIDSARIIIQNVLKTIGDKPNTSYYFQKRKGEAYNYLGIFDNKQANYESSLSYHFRAIKIRKQIKDSIGLAQSNHNLGMFYRRQKEYEKSIDYFKKAIAFRSRLGDSLKLAISHNMLGVIYYYKGEEDRALFHYSKSKELSTDKYRVAKVNINIATLFFSKRQYSKAIEIYKQNIELFTANNDRVDLSINMYYLARIYSEAGQYQMAIEYIDKSVIILKELGHKELLYKNYLIRSDINERAKNNTEALTDFKLYKTYLDSVTNVEKAKNVKSIELNHKFKIEKLIDSIQFAREKKIDLAQIRTLNAENKIKILWIVFGGLGTLLIVFFGYYRYKQHLKYSELENELLNIEITNKKKDLVNFAMNITESQSWATILETKLENLKASKGRGQAKMIKELELEIKNKLHIVDVESVNIQDKIDALSSSFYEKLHKLFPNLTKSEIKLSSLIKLNLDSKQIAILQNIAPASVKMGRNRLRKKLNLPSSTDLHQFFRDF